MPLDAITLKAVALELNEALTGARIEKIHQPEPKTVVFTLRTSSGHKRLLISSGSSPRILLTSEKIENPSTPPMFCMLLRKHLTSARIRRITQPGLERIAQISFEAANELGDMAEKTLTAELFGRRANIILTGPDGRIIDCLVKTDLSESDTRAILPGMFYKLPEAPGRADFRELSKDALIKLFPEEGLPDDKILSSLFMGLSPLVARELIFRAQAKGGDKNALALELLVLSERINKNAFKPVMLIKNGETPLDYSFMEIHQYGGYVTLKKCGSFSEMMDGFYLEKERVLRRKNRTSELNKTVTTALERLMRKLSLQKEEYKRSLDRDQLRKYGDLLMAGLHLAKKGITKIKVPDFYEGGDTEIEIPLDSKLSPQQNAQRYYKNFNRMKNAEAALKIQISETEREIEYLESVLDELSRAGTAPELSDIREELLSSGYLKDKNKSERKGNASSSSRLRPLKYVTGDGFTVFAGRNNRQNEELTLKSARKTDLWFHTQKIPGSHVILVINEKPATENAKNEAAIIAAYHSKAADSARVPVDFTEVRFVRKLPGGKSGMVTYKNFETAIVTPDRKTAEKMRVED